MQASLEQWLCLTRLEPTGRNSKLHRAGGVGMVVGSAMLWGVISLVSCHAQEARTSAELPLAPRLIAKTIITVQAGDTVSSLLAALDFAKAGNPSGRIDAVQLAEIAAMTSADTLTPGERIFVDAASASGIGRHIVLHLAVLSPNGRAKFWIRLNDDGTYTKSYPSTR